MASKSHRLCFTHPRVRAVLDTVPGHEIRCWSYFCSPDHYFLHRFYGSIAAVDCEVLGGTHTLDGGVSARPLPGQTIAGREPVLSISFVIQCVFAYAQLPVGKVTNLEAREQTPSGEGRGNLRLPRSGLTTVHISQFLYEPIYLGFGAQGAQLVVTLCSFASGL